LAFRAKWALGTEKLKSLSFCNAKNGVLASLGSVLEAAKQAPDDGSSLTSTNVKPWAVVDVVLPQESHAGPGNNLCCLVAFALQPDLALSSWLQSQSICTMSRRGQPPAQSLAQLTWTAFMRNWSRDGLC
jgi:hypothetical protein